MAQKASGKDPNVSYKRVALVFGILAVFLIALSFFLNIPLATGKAVILKTLPVDPFDPLRGQYMAIRYEINTIPPIKGANEGTTVYVLLRENENKTWDYATASTERPKEGIFIKGNIEAVKKKEMTVKYGIEQYFFERGGQIPVQNITVEAKVDRKGNARIVQLLHNMEPVEIEFRKVPVMIR
ncbi:GDYXXLXY domain-containing protein [Candidatus Woesearchaeota archaeon]|nr:GDYXXLXY domain-containing protein [Candidatus Woesearchaeota archaeon]